MELKASAGARLIVHGEHDAGHDLRHEEERQDAAERPQVVEVARGGKVDELRVHEPPDGEALIHPLAKARLGLVGQFVKSHVARAPQPILIFVSEMYS